MDEGMLRRYGRLLDGPLRSLAVALCWSVVTGVDRRTVLRRVGADPAEVVERPLSAAYDPGHDGCLWFVRQVGDAVALLEVNGYQASREAVQRRLSEGTEMYSVYWNVNNDNAFNYAARGELVTHFEGDFADERYGTAPDALETVRDPLWTLAGEDGWQAAALALIEARTGVAMDESWVARPQPSVLAPALPDDPAPVTLDGELHRRLRDDAGPGRRAALAWLLQRLADEFGLRDEPAVAKGIAALRAGARLDDDARRRVFELRDRLGYDGPVDDRMAADPDWRRSQVGWALAKALCPPPWDDAAAVEALEHARGALGDAWPAVAAHLLSQYAMR